ncbi:hypothetical protein KO481_39410 [Nocardia sp. NEAU-G5]|uniref:Uncharacterized protein n=1 Tax=Nocardia albiluteola TaxID=2842303 RepID=A0ABS6BBC4_9NOCA|nr:hypothetical protein [Nocardia albiluteola]MBU3067577.1 hypothetical protein [Nocardia albiluteola]
MLHTRPHRAEHRPLFPALRDYARRSLARHFLTREERANLAASRGRPAVYSASLGCHPHF